MEKVKLAELKASIEEFEQWCKSVQTIPNAIVIGEAAFRFLLENTLVDRSEPSASEPTAGRCLAAAADGSVGCLAGLPFYIDKHMVPNEIKIGVMTFYQGIPDFRVIRVIRV
jgi:hypothetical protein